MHNIYMFVHKKVLFWPKYLFMLKKVCYFAVDLQKSIKLEY